MDENLIYVNGIDGKTGEYLVAPMSIEKAVALAYGKPKDDWLSGWLGSIWKVLQRPFLGLPLDIDPSDVSRAGWGIVFPENISPEIRNALEPLISYRRKQIPPDRCKVLDYTPGTHMRDWLKNYNVATGSVKPQKLPYYLLLVGDPTMIPFEFQYLLGIEYAVGRLAFDTPDQYRQYAESVVAYETAGKVPNSREIVYWATRHASDPATQMSADHLIAPLYEGIPDSDEEDPIAEMDSYRQRCLKKKDAQKANLLEILCSKETASPAMLFTASHGMGWPKEEYETQRAGQGALLCQDWTGFGPVKPNHYLTGAEIPDDARVHGMIAFLFACFGAGTPQYDNFLKDRSQGPVPIADKPFVAALPQRLLSHPQGSALAVLGHIERAWGYSIVPKQKIGAQIVPFRNCLGRILAGEPVGHSTKDFSRKYAILSTELLNMLDKTKAEDEEDWEPPSDEELAWYWIERNDAQNYIVLGDPAVQIRVDLLE